MKKILLFLLFTAVTSLLKAQDLSVSVITTNITCNGSCDGVITANASGGSGGYEYSLREFSGTVLVDYNSSNIFTGLCVGSFEVFVKDSNNNTVSSTAVIVEPAVLAAQVMVTKEPVEDNNDGEITATAIGGTPPYTYSIDGTMFQVSTVFTGLTAGDYTITVLDANGCFTTEFVTLSPTLSLEELNSKEIGMRPNPTLKDLTVSNKVIGKEYSIVNLLGKELKSGIVKTNTITTSNLTNGVYFLKVEGYKAAKFIKN